MVAGGHGNVAAAAFAQTCFAERIKHNKSNQATAMKDALF